MVRLVSRQLVTLTLIASMAYSTWNRRPSGEKVLTPRSYSDLVRNMLIRGQGLDKYQEKNRQVTSSQQPVSK